MPSELIVTGFHRSGTSMVTQLLHTAGLHVGDDLLGAAPSNPYGHFEDRGVVRFHDGVLADNGLNWQVGEPFAPHIAPARWQEARRIVTDRRVAHDSWGFKDPRASLFLGVWKHLMPEAKVLVVFRPPVEAVSSLEWRHASQYFAEEGPLDDHIRFWREPDLGLRMWIEYNAAVLRVADRHPDDFVAVSFDTVRSGFPLVRFLAERWRLGLDPVPSQLVFDPDATNIDTYPLAVSDSALVDAATGVWGGLVDLEALTTLSWEPGRAA